MKYLDCEFDLPEYESGNCGIPLEKLGGRHPALEELNCLAVRWEEMNDLQKRLIEKWNELWDKKQEGNMCKLVNAAYNVDSYEYEEGDNPEERGRIVLRKGCKYPKDVYQWKELPVKPEEYVFQLQYGNSKLTLPVYRQEVLDEYLSRWHEKKMAGFKTVIMKIDSVDICDLTLLNELAKDFDSLPDTESRVDWLTEFNQSDFWDLSEALQVSKGIMKRMQETSEQELTVGM